MARRWAHMCSRNLIKHEFSSQSVVEDLWSLFANSRREFAPVNTHSLAHAQLNRGFLVGLSQCSHPVPNSRPFRELEEDFADSRRGFASVNTRSLARAQAIRGFVARLSQCSNPAPNSERTEESRKPLATRRRGATVAHLKERGFDDIIEREKQLTVLLRIKDLLAADPTRSMTLLDLGKHKADIGFVGNGRLVAFLKQYPAIFRVHETTASGKLPWFRLTSAAEAILDEEVGIRDGMEGEAVVKVRKLLMMASGGALPLAKVAHLARDLGFPKGVAFARPGEFRVVDEGATLELVRWSEELALTEAEWKAREGKLREIEHADTGIPKRRRLSKFEEVECPSPYQDGTHLHHRSLQFEKRTVLVVEELLSLTLEKRLLVDHLTHFRKEFNFSKKVYGMLIRHPDYFYVSRKGMRDTVFLRRAFEESHAPGKPKEYHLIDKHPLVLVKEKFAALMEADSAQAPFHASPVPDHDLPVPAQRTTIPW